ncbi:MAG: hypothetical protein AAFY35_03285 [Pseudomonadota bacterium]
MKPKKSTEMKLDETSLLGLRDVSVRGKTSANSSDALPEADVVSDLGRLHSKVGVTGEDF